MLKHVVWREWKIIEMNAIETAGRVGVRLEDERLEVEQLGGKALPARLLLPVLDAALGEGWEKEAERLHEGRAHPWRVEVRQGASGARDYRLRVLESLEWRNVPIRAVIHVSMYGILNQGVRLWLGDLPPLLAAIALDHTPNQNHSLQVHEPDEPSGFLPPGKESGLQEALEIVRPAAQLSA